MTEHEQQQPEPEQGQPSTPLLDNLTRETNFYGFYSLREMLDDSLVKGEQSGIPQLWTVVGGVTRGKTTLMGELLATSFWQTHLSPQKEPLALHHVAFEDAQKAAKMLGLIAPERQAGSYTPEDYQQANLVYEQALQLALRQGGMIFTECPGLVGRGDKAVEDLLDHRDGFAELEYDTTFVFLTAGQDITTQGRRVRHGFTQDPLQKEDVLEHQGVTVFRGSQEDAVGGGGDHALFAYNKAENEYLYSLIQQGITTPLFSLIATHPSIFLSNEIKALFLEQRFLPYFLWNHDPIMPEHIYVGRNTKVASPILYQNYLEEFNDIRKLGKLHQLGLLCP